MYEVLNMQSKLYFGAHSRLKFNMIVADKRTVDYHSAFNTTLKLLPLIDCNEKEMKNYNLKFKWLLFFHFMHTNAFLVWCSGYLFFFSLISVLLIFQCFLFIIISGGIASEYVYVHVA